MPEQEWLLIPEPTMVQSNVLAKELRQAAIAMAEVLQEMGNPVDREPALSAFAGLPV